MPKARKLKSGAWNIQVYEYTDESGKRHYKSFTAETKAEVEYLVAAYKTHRIDYPKKSDLTVRQAIDNYIELSEVLSPTTLAAYRKIKQYAFQSIMDEKVSDLTDDKVQTAINIESKRKVIQTGKRISAKTVKNEYTLLSSALKNAGRAFHVKLPSVQKKVKDYPSPETVLQAIQGSSIELPCMLAMWLSFSLSEIRGIMCSSIRGDCVYVDRVLVDVDNVPTLKENAKVETRLRKHQLPPHIKKLIYQQETWKRYNSTGIDELLIDLNASQLRSRWQKICRNNGFELSFHGLRHMNASIMLMLNIPEKYAMERGGWKTPHTMKSVYQHTFSEERQLVDAKINSYFEKMLNEPAEQGLETPAN